MTDYKLLTADTPEGLNAAVVACLTAGYSLHGSPGVTQGIKGLIFSQAVTK